MGASLDATWPDIKYSTVQYKSLEEFTWNSIASHMKY